MVVPFVFTILFFDTKDEIFCVCFYIKRIAFNNVLTSLKAIMSLLSENQSKQTISNGETNNERDNSNSISKFF